MKYQNIEIGIDLDGNKTLFYQSDRLVHIVAGKTKIILTQSEADKIVDIILFNRLTTKEKENR